MINFRFHQDSLSESLATSKKFDGLTELLNYLIKNHNIYYLDKKTKLVKQLFKIHYYGYDDRCNQHLFMVFYNRFIVGFIFEEREDIK